MAWYNKIREFLFGNDETFEGDTLYPVLYWSTCLIRSKFHRTLTKMVLLLAVLNLAIFCWYILKVEPVTELLSCVPVQIGQAQVILSYIVLLTSQSRIKKISRMLKLFKILADTDTTVGSRGKIHQQINRKSKMIINFMYFSFMLIFLTFSLYVPVHGNKSVHFFLIFVTKYFPTSLTTVTTGVYIVICYHVAHSTLAPGFILAYFSSHIQFQLLLLQEALKHIGAGYHSDTLESADNDVYQQNVKRRLKACVIHHVLIKRVFNEFNGLIYGPLISYLISGAILAGIFVIALLNKPDSFGSILIVAIVASFQLMATWFGQKLVNESEEMYRCLTRCPWHLWNKENRQFLQLLLIHSEVPLTISTGNIATLDNETIIKFVKGIYTIIAFYKSMGSLGT